MGVPLFLETSFPVKAAFKLLPFTLAEDEKVMKVEKMKLQLQWQPSKWQDEDGSQDKQIYKCIVAGVELDKCATGHEMSNQQSEKARSSPSQTWIALGKPVATYNFAASLFCTAQTPRLRTSFRPWWLVPVPKLQFLAFAVELFWHLALTTSTMEILRVARLGWFPRQANLPLHGRWHRI